MKLRIKPITKNLCWSCSFSILVFSVFIFLSYSKLFYPDTDTDSDSDYDHDNDFLSLLENKFTEKILQKKFEKKKRDEREEPEPGE